MMEKLKACPFCGSKAKITDHGGFFTVGCQNIDCAATIDLLEPNEENATYDWNRRAAPENKPLTLDELRQMDGERVWAQFRGLGMYGLVAYHSDPDGDDGDDIYITNNLGGRSTFEEILSQGGTVYAHKPEWSEP